MGDKYTVYPDHLKKRIDAVDSLISDIPRFREWWTSLPAEERARLEALPPEEQRKEIARLRGAKPDDPNLENPDTPPDKVENPDDAPLPPEGETIESLKEKLEKAEQRYRTLQGMIKDPAELERQNNFLLTQIKALQDQIYELKKPPVEAKTDLSINKVSVREALKSHYEKLGEDLAPEILEKEIAKDEKLFELLESRAGQRISEVATKFDGKFKLSAEEQFNKDLNNWGDWKAMWSTPEFQAFLAEEADVTGIERYAIIQDAFARFDSRVVLRAFDKFTGKGKPPVSDKGGGIDPSKVKNRIGAPRSSGAPVKIDNNPNNQMSPQEARKRLAQLTADYTRGLWKGNKEEYDREYARLFNLVRGGTG